MKIGTAEAAMLGSVHTDAQAHFRYKLQLQTIQFTTFFNFYIIKHVSIKCYFIIFNSY